MSNKPHILFVSPSLDTSSAIGKMMHHICNNLINSTGEITHYTEVSKYNKTPFNIIVACSPREAYTVREIMGDEVNIVSLCHAFPDKSIENFNRVCLMSAKPSHVLVTSHEDIAAKVRSWGFNATYLGITFDSSKFRHLPYPHTFTIGYMGNASENHKRFYLIEKIANDNTIPIILSRRDGHSGGPHTKKELDFYQAISCYVCATTCERAPFPIAESLLCGRPVVATHIADSPNEINNHIYKVNIDNIDNDEEVYRKLSSAVLHVRQDFDEFALISRHFKLVDRSHMYEEAILGAL